MSDTLSISKLKSELRQAQRLISRNDKLNANLRVETERRIESLKSQIQEEQQRRGTLEPCSAVAIAVDAQLVDSVSPDAPEQAAAESANQATKTKSKNKKSAKEDKYKMLRHVEFQKSTRRLKQAERQLAAIAARLEALPKDASKSTRKASKTLEKEKAAAEIKREHALVDSWYGIILPPHFKYVALYPAGNYVEFDDLPELPRVSSSAAAETALEIYTAGTPPARKPDEVRSYWRAVVKARLARGDLQGPPQKSKAVGNATTKASKGGKASRKTAVSQEPVDLAAGLEQAQNDVDDFFE